MRPNLRQTSVLTALCATLLACPTGSIDDDAAPLDAGASKDAGANARDGGARDSGARDGGATRDSGVVPGDAGASRDAGGGGGADAGERDTSPATARPCDLYASGGTPCIAAHSTIRALYRSYDGKLYQVRRKSDTTTKDINALSPGGFADAAAQDTFCSGATCEITIVYDQSGKGNHLEYQGPGSSCGGSKAPSKATDESLSVGGHKVYSLYITRESTYWRDGHATGVPTGKQPEGMYMVTSGTHVNGGCCFDYGNSETTRKADAAGAMDAINFSTQCWFGGCKDSGPWVQADLEWGLFPGGSKEWNSDQKSFSSKYVTAMLKNDGVTKFALKGGNAQSGALTTLYDGALPSGYTPMRKQGAIVLGSGGDCCAPGTGPKDSVGTFYEGAIAAGYPSDATDSAIQENIIAAGYGASGSGG